MKTAYIKQEGKLKNKVKAIGIVIKHSTELALEDANTHMFAAGVGLQQGLKYNGDVTRGVKAGLAAYGVVVVGTTAMNIARNIDIIKGA